MCPAPAAQQHLPVPGPLVKRGTAADLYIAEREQKRRDGIAIPKHVKFAGQHAGTLAYGGLRRSEGQTLALLRQRDTVLVLVLEVDEATAQRLKRLPLDASVAVNASGAIRKTGRRR